MKKQILSLMLSAAIFTTSPLFAMDPQPEDKGKSITHLCPVCKPALRFADVKDNKSKGHLAILPNDINIQILENLSPKDLLVCSWSSKGMYNFCQNPLFWDRFVKEYTFAVNTKLDRIPQFARFPSHLKLFSAFEDETRYSITREQCQHFMATPCEPTWWVEDAVTGLEGTASYQFSIGEDQYEMFVTRPDPGYSLLDQQKITFIEKYFQNGYGAIAKWEKIGAAMPCFTTMGRLSRAYIMPLSFRFVEEPRNTFTKQKRVKEQ